jgi:ABC-2 type transport system permease protein
MSRVWAIAKREYASFFRTPLGWVVIALFLLLAGSVFAWGVLRPGEAATLRPFFNIWWGLLMVVAPAISMRLFSEDLRTGTIEPLLTAPVTEAAVVAGKYAGSVMFLASMLVPSLVYAVVLGMLTEIDPGPIAAGYLGILLLGMLYLAVGLLASALTSSQTLAFLATLVGFMLLEVITRTATVLPERVADIVFALSPNLRMADFARGIIDTAHIGFFLAGSFLFLAVTAVVLQSRRWR